MLCCLPTLFVAEKHDVAPSINVIPDTPSEVCDVSFYMYLFTVSAQDCSEHLESFFRMCQLWLHHLLKKQRWQAFMSEYI